MMDPMMETVFEESKKKLWDGQANSEDKLLLAILYSGEDTREKLEELNSKMDQKKDMKITGGAAVGGAGVGAAILQFFKSFVNLW